MGDQKVDYADTQKEDCGGFGGGVPRLAGDLATVQDQGKGGSGASSARRQIRRAGEVHHGTSIV